MDPLTKNLLSRLGRTPGLPKLPPVNNVCLMNLQKGLQPAETTLHTARLRLQDLQQAQETGVGVAQAATDLHLAMANLEGREQDYFANTYTGPTKGLVLEGWKDWKREQLRLKITALANDAQNRLLLIQQNVNMDPRTRDSAILVSRTAIALRTANNRWYNAQNIREATRPHGVIQEGENIRRSLQTIRDNLRYFEALPQNTPNRALNITSIKTSLADAQRCERLFKAVVEGKWVSTDETRP